MAGLTNKQKVFVEEYLQCWNATEAARRAGYKHPNVSGPRNIVKAGIQTKIAERLAAKAMDTDEVLARLGDQARGDLGDFLDITPGKVALNLEKAKGQTHLIKKFRQTKDGVSIELYDAQAALEKLARAHGLFIDRQQVEHSGEIRYVTKIIRPPDSEEEDE